MARGPCGSPPGFTLLELLFVVAIVGTLTVMAVPQGLRALDDFRARSAARYLALRVAEARVLAVQRQMSRGLRFQPGTPDYRMTTVVDGNGNGLRTAELSAGVDHTLTSPELLADHFRDVAFGLLDGVPDADGLLSGADGVRLGASSLLSVNPDGTCSSGTLYVHGRGRTQYAVRVLGVTGRVRILKFDPVRGRWTDV